MGHQIIRQPNGKWAVFSSVVDDFVLLDATRDDIVEMRVQDARETIEREIDQKIAALEAGQRAYFQFTMSWDEACKWAREVHGPKWKPPECAERRAK